MSTTVKAVTSDELFQEWLNKADMNTLKKYFEKKKIEFKREHVSPVETVRNVSKFLVVYFEKKVSQDLLTQVASRTEQTSVNNLQRIKFYDFQGKKSH